MARVVSLLPLPTRLVVGKIKHDSKCKIINWTTTLDSHQLPGIFLHSIANVKYHFDSQSFLYCREDVEERVCEEGWLWSD